MNPRLIAAIPVLALVVWTTAVGAASGAHSGWTHAQLDELRSLSLLALEPLPADPTNRVADDPAAAALGRLLFFDTRLSANGRVACSTCHEPERGFQDGRALAVGVGTTARRAMPVAGMARAPFLFWDGRKDSLWAQALGPLESAVEHGATRLQVARVIASHYRDQYETVFGQLPDLSDLPGGDLVTAIFVNVGKAIAAFERLIGFGASRFDRYVEALTEGRSGAAILTREEEAGLRVFIGKGHCTQCHNGPLLTNNEFHNTGVPPRPELPRERGRFEGAHAVVRDEFNCRSRWSDARGRCPELEFMVTGDHAQERAYKVPSLRNVAERAPYMHAGQLSTLAEVIGHYDRAPAAPAGQSELHALRLSASERRQLEAFLRTLSGALDIAGSEAGPVPR